MIESPTDQDFQQWAREQLDQVRSGSHPARQRAIKEIADEVRSHGKPALEALVQLVLTVQAGEEAIHVLSEVGAAAIPYLVDILKARRLNTRRSPFTLPTPLELDFPRLRRHAISALGRLGALEFLIELLKDEDETMISWNSPGPFSHLSPDHVIQAIGCGIGQPALDHLIELLEHDSDVVRCRTVRALALIGTPALKPLSSALSDPNITVCTAAAEALAEIGEPALPHLVPALHDPRPAVRSAIVRAARNPLFHDRRPLPTVAVIALEDERSGIVGDALDTLDALHNPESVEAAYNAIIDELVIRESHRPASYFNATVTADALQALIRQVPRLHNEIQSTLCEIAYGYDEPVRARAVTVARNLSPEDFAARVKATMIDDPETAAEIMRQLGGAESAAFFAALQAELQTEALENYHQRLQELEEIGLRRWEELTAQTRWGFYINMGMGIGLFLVGTAIIIWGLVLLTRSDSLAQQVGGGVLTALSALATTYSGRFWKDPVQHVQRFSAQQARVQAAFIGYMNCIGQLRLAFERDYTLGNIDPDTAERYQRMMNEAIEQISQQLAEY